MPGVGASRCGEGCPGMAETAHRWGGPFFVTHRCRVTGSKQGGQIRVFYPFGSKQGHLGPVYKKEKPRPSLSARPAASLTSPGGPCCPAREMGAQGIPCLALGDCCSPSSAQEQELRDTAKASAHCAVSALSQRTALRPGEQLVTRGRQPRAGVGRTAWPCQVCFSAS